MNPEEHNSAPAEESRAHGEELALSKLYPVALRSILVRGWRTYVVFALGGGILRWYLATQGTPPTLENYQAIQLGAQFALYVLVAWTIVRTLYLVCYIKRLGYEINGGDFIIRRGVLLIERGVFPLAKITDIYTNASWLDLLLGLRNVQITTRSQESGQFARIDGLDSRAASSFRQALESLTSRARISEAKGNVFSPNVK